MRFLLGLVLLAILPGCGVGYLVEQSYGQLAMLSRREPIARVLRERDLTTQTRDRLTVIWYARDYARRAIGLNVGASYRDIVRLDRDAASYVVAAAPSDSLEPYHWCFPVAGCLPYIGYFNRQHAEREKQRLTALGYDVALRRVEAYSLGGWLPDPVYSPLLEDSRGWVANTVIHELTHGTVFLSGRAAFNESFATFVGDHGEIAFLSAHYGPNSATVAQARRELEDSRTFGEVLTHARADLQALYASNASHDEKMRQKDDILARAEEQIDGLAPRGRRRPRTRALNNAVLATHATYYGDEARFQAVYERLGNDLRRFVLFVHDQVARQRDPEAFMSEWIRTH